MNYKQVLGSKIKKARSKAKLTRRAVSLALRKRGISLTEFTLYNWERGFTSPQAHRLYTLAEILQVDPRYFFELKRNQMVTS